MTTFKLAVSSAFSPTGRPRAGIIHAVFPSRRGLLPSVRALLDFLARECAAHRVRMGRSFDEAPVYLLR